MKWVTKSSRDIVIVMGGDGLARGLAFFGSLLIVKMATSVEMGVFSFFFSALSILVPLSELGMNLAMVRFISSVHTTEQERASLLRTALVLRVTLLSLVIGVTLVGANAIVTRVFNNPDFATALRLACLATLGLSLHTLATSYFQADQRFMRMFLVRASESVTRFLLIVLLLFTVGLYIDVVMLIYGVAPLLVALTALSPFLREMRHGTFHRELVRRFLKYSRWIVVSTIATTFALQLDVLILARMVTTEVLGEYGAALRLVVPIQVIGNAVVTVLFPRFSKERSVEGLKILYFRFLRIAVPLALVLAVACLVAAPLLLKVFPQYGAFGPLLQILGVTFSLAVALNLGGLIFYSLDRPHVVAFVNIGQLLLSFTANSLLIPVLGAKGAAISAALVWLGGGLTLTMMAIRVLRRGDKNQDQDLNLDQDLEQGQQQDQEA